MTVNVDTNLFLPQDTDNYNLIADLNVFKGSIVNSLNDVITELGQRPETGSNAAFNSIVCTASGVFGGSVSIVSSDTGSNLVIDNSSAGYGFTKGATSFRFNGSKFVSSAPIQIVDGTAGQDAASRNYIASQMAIAASWDAAVLAQVVALDERSVTRYNGLQTWAPNANYASSAAYASDAAHAANADYAASAGSAPVGAHSHAYADSAGDAALINGRRIVAGKSGQFSTPGGADQNKTVSFGTTFSAVPTVVYSITEDDGKQSMLSSIDTITTTGFTVNVTNTNSSTTENYKIIWIAIG